MNKNVVRRKVITLTLDRLESLLGLRCASITNVDYDPKNRWLVVIAVDDDITLKSDGDGAIGSG